MSPLWLEPKYFNSWRQVSFNFLTFPQKILNLLYCYINYNNLLKCFLTEFFWWITKSKSCGFNFCSTRLTLARNDAKNQISGRYLRLQISILVVLN